jgi:glucosamine-6-phosphate deaminase
LGNVAWTDALIKRAVLWLSEKTNKALLKLDDNGFREHNLHQLLRHHGPAQRVAHRVFRWMMDTIEYHPGGRERKRVICFSPHPDDDVISMGGTLIRLVEDQHEVHVAYMTSGNIAVFDHDARRFIDYVDEFLGAFGNPAEQSNAGSIKERVDKFLDAKKPGQPDTPEVLKIKGLIRATEARAAALACGIPPEQLEFMDLRFYRTGTVEKEPIHKDDVVDIVALLERLRPAQIYVAGEMSDPHGTHRTCAEAIFAAVPIVKSKGHQFDVWLYRGAWEEWEAHEVEMAVPISSDVLEQKKQAIFRHQSQKDKAMFPGGTDRREFWQRSEARNIATAKTYDALGLPEYYALEAFVKWKDS